MIVSAKAEIHFHQQEQASVYLESTGSGNCEIVSEIGLLTVLAIRVFSNLGDDAYSSKLAEFFLFLSDSLASTAETNDLGLIEMIPYPGYQGRKVFVATMELTDDAFKGNVTSTGFDTVMTGYQYYGPISVLAFVQFLLTKHAQDCRSTDGFSFLIFLRLACRLCAQLHTDRCISLFNHNQLAANLILESCRPYF